MLIYSDGPESDEYGFLGKHKCDELTGNERVCKLITVCEYNSKDKTCSRKKKPKATTKPESDESGFISQNECDELTGKEKDCKKLIGCEFNSKDKTCSKKKKPKATTGAESDEAGFISQNECDELTGNEKGCKGLPGCDYNSKDKTCSRKGKPKVTTGTESDESGFISQNECDELTGKEKDCKKLIGCEFNSKDKTCSKKKKSKATSGPESDEAGFISKNECDELTGNEKGCKLMQECEFNSKNKTCSKKRKPKVTTGAESDEAGFISQNECDELTGNEKDCKKLIGCEFNSKDKTCSKKKKPKATTGAESDESGFISKNECDELTGNEWGCNLMQECEFNSSNKTCSKKKKPKVTTGAESDEAGFISKNECDELTGNEGGCKGLPGCEFNSKDKTCSKKKKPKATTGAESDEAGFISKNECDELTGDEGGCKGLPGCDYNSEDKTCSKKSGKPKAVDEKRPDSVECAKFNDKAKDCELAGCFYDARADACIVNEEKGTETKKEDEKKEDLAEKKEDEKEKKKDEAAGITLDVTTERTEVSGNTTKEPITDRSVDYDTFDDKSSNNKSDVARPIDEECAKYSDNPCQCKKFQCEYDATTRSCVAGGIICSHDGPQCRRPSTWYMEGTVVCQSLRKSGRCNVTKTVMAVNMNGIAFIDSTGVKYEADSRVPREVNPPEMGEELSMRPAKSDDITQQDIFVYEEYRTGNRRNHFYQPCLKYHVPISEDGVYELSLKLGDFIYDSPGMRTMNFKFNGLIIGMEFDVMQYARDRFYMIEVNMNFKVTRDGHILNLPGRPATRIANGVVPLEFCHGGCEPQYFKDNVWHSSAWSVAKLESGPPPKSEDLECAPNNQHSSGCVTNGCQFQVENGLCVHGSQECSTTFFEEISKCTRSGAYYASGGVLCKNKGGGNECDTPTNTVYALNLNGKDLVDSRGISYIAEDKNSSIDPMEYRVLSSESEKCVDVEGVSNDADKELYSTFIYGDATKDFKDGCVVYPMPICQDGNYELSIKMVESKLEKQNLRCFEVLINNVPVLVDIDILRAAQDKRKCEAVEIIIGLQVQRDARVLRVLGHPIPIEINGHFNISFCFGQCDLPEKSFQVSAISLARFGEGTKACERLNVYNCDSCACQENGFEYNLITEKCVAADKGLGPCNFEGNGCRRENTFYSNAGVLCKNKEELGDCSSESSSTLSAISFDGRFKGTYKDSRGVEYETEHTVTKAINLVNKDRRGRLLIKECPKILGLHKDYSEQDGKNIYQTVVFTNQFEKSSTQFRLSYPFAICEDGKYEMTLKTVEPFYNYENTRRFDVSLNNVTVLSGVDVTRLSEGNKCVAIDIVVEFEVTNSTTQFIAKGHNVPVPISSNKLELGLASGHCSTNDHSVVMSGVTLVRNGGYSKKCSLNVES